MQVHDVQQPAFDKWKMWRSIVFYAIAFVAIVAAQKLPLGKIGTLLDLPEWIGAALANVAFLFVFVLVSEWVVRGDGATIKRLEHGELPCWNCGYNLNAAASPTSSTTVLCPECGTADEIASLRERWERWKKG